MGITMVFFAMFGSTFLLTQYFQFVLGYTPFETGIRFLPIAASMMILSPLSARFVQRDRHEARGRHRADAGHRRARVVGVAQRVQLVLARHRLAPGAHGRRHGTHDGAGDRIDHGRRSRSGKAGVGSAVNDTTRQVGGALGVAVIGSVLASIYGSQVGDFLAGQAGAERHRRASSSSRSGSRSPRASRCPGSPTPPIDAFIDGHARGRAGRGQRSRSSAR